jgi:hypothetical protein
MDTCDYLDPLACTRENGWGICLPDPSNGTYRCYCDPYAKGVNCSYHLQLMTGGVWIGHQIFSVIFGLALLVPLIPPVLMKLKRLPSDEKKSRWRSTTSPVLAVLTLIERIIWPFIPVVGFYAHFFHKWVDYLGGDNGICFIYSVFVNLALIVQMERSKGKLTEEQMEKRYRATMIVLIVVVLVADVSAVAIDYELGLGIVDYYSIFEAVFIVVGLLGSLVCSIWLMVLLRTQSKSLGEGTKGRGTTIRLVVFAVWMSVGMLCVIGFVLWNITSGEKMDTASPEGYSRYYALERTFEWWAIASLFALLGLSTVDAWKCGWWHSVSSSARTATTTTPTEEGSV